jgi:hypothetical protein
MPRIKHALKENKRKKMSPLHNDEREEMLEARQPEI